MHKLSTDITNSLDAHGNSQWSLRGSREATANNFSSSNMISTEVTKIWLGTRHQKTPPYGASHDIVPFRGATHVDHTVDVSMALALAMSNSGKLQNIEFFSNATVGKERIMHRGSLYFRDKSGSSTDQFPFSSHLQIGEVSKGVQQLNKILKACSNGLSLSRDSIDIGRELLKGAMDLEESLRMLVSLQEASDYMVGSQGRQVRLLKGKEDEESSSHEVNRKKLMNRPRFSFDRPTLHSHKHDREGGDADFQNHTKLALSYLENPKTPTSNSNKTSSKASMKSISHRRSLSCGSGSKADATKNSHCEELKSFKNESNSFKNESNDSCSSKNIKQLGPKANPVNEKVRIPGVVAKLMGLEELPLPKAQVKIKGEAQKNPKSSNGRETTQTSKTSSVDPENKKEVDDITHSEKKLYQMDIQGIMEPKATHNAKAMDSKGKTNSKNLNNMEDISSALKHSPKPQSKLNDKQIDMTNMYPTKDSRVTKKEMAETGETTDVKEQTYRGKAQQIIHNAEKPLLEHDIQCTTSLSYIDNVDAVKHKLAQRKKDQPLEGKRNLVEGSIIPSNQSNTSNDKAAHQQPAVGVFKSKHAGHEIPTEKEQISRSKPQPNIVKKGELKLNTERASDDMSTQKVLTGSSTTVASKRTPTETTNKAQLKEHQHLKNRRSTHHEVGRKSVGRSLGERRPFGTPRTDKEKATPPLQETMSKKSAHILSAQNVDTTKTLSHRTQSNRYLEEEPIRIETPPAERQHLKDSTSLLQELERRWKERSGKAKGVIVSSHAMNSEQLLQHKTATYNALTNDCSGQGLADRRTIVVNYDHDITIAAPPAQQHPEISSKDDVEQQSILKENEPEGPQDRMQQNSAMSEVDKQGSLTRNENILKQIMINSQHFLNTAQALFKLKIPVGVLQASENACSDEGSKLLLDCGYEIMRRKGKKEEVFSPKTMPFAPAKVGCLDALIKELNDDLECLKAPSKIEGDDNDTAECLHKLLEREIQNRNPDVNCMWDFGWNTTSFGEIEKHEVIRDVEKHVLNGLINELARDLANVSITA